MRSDPSTADTPQTTERAEQIAFPTLSEAAITLLEPYAERRRVAEGDVLWQEGERDFDFFVVLAGQVEVTEHSGDDEQQVTVHGPGEFTGDIDLLSGRSSLVTGVVREAGEVLALTADCLRQVVAEVPQLSDVLLHAFLARRDLLLRQGFAGLRIIGSQFSDDTYRLTEFASRNQVPYTWLDVERDRNAEQVLRQVGFSVHDTPVVICRDRVLRNPSNREVAECMGLTVSDAGHEVHDLVVVGAGPAGLAAAVYGASEGLKTLVLESTATGGQAGSSSRIENYLGFPAGITGDELAERARLQAQKFGACFSIPCEATGLRRHGGLTFVDQRDSESVAARTVIIATGVSYRRLEVPGRERFDGRGVYYGATQMEANLCRNEPIAVVGGGNSAGQAALFLSACARQVYLLVRGEDLISSMSRYLISRIERCDNIELRPNTVITAIHGDETLAGVAVHDRARERDETLAVSSLFSFIGAEPHTEWVAGALAADRYGFLLTGNELPRHADTAHGWPLDTRSPFLFETSLPGVFAVGDVRSGSVKRVASAVGEGSIAVKFCHQVLSGQVS